MAKAKTPRTNSGSRSKNVATMPDSSVTQAESQAVAETRKHSAPIPINLESEIRRRAYEISEQRGFQPGFEDQDWLTAEQEVMARYNQKQTA